MNNRGEYFLIQAAIDGQSVALAIYQAPEYVLKHFCASGTQEIAAHD